MTLRRLAVLQWAGLVLGGAVWFAQHIAGWGFTEAACNDAHVASGISNDVWQAVLVAAAAVLVIAAGLAAAAVVRGTQDASYEGAPPASRLRFFAIAALVANAIFLMIVLLDGVGSIADPACRGA